MKTPLIAMAASASILALTACNKPEPAPAPTDAMAPAETSMAATPAAGGSMVGGVAMNPMDPIPTNAAKAPNLTTLVSAVQAAGLTATLAGTGPFTVFAPDNAAFEKIPAATREGLMAPTGKAALTKILTYHVVPGRLTAADLVAQAQANGGKVELTTVQGGKLTATANPDGSVTLTDAKGEMSRITQADVMQSNGVVHIIDTVVMPD